MELAKFIVIDKLTQTYRTGERCHNLATAKAVADRIRDKGGKPEIYDVELGKWLVHPSVGTVPVG